MMNAAQEAEAALTMIVSPLIGVLAMSIGCSILDDAGYSDYQPIYIAARMGALGGPIAALFCVLISATFVIDDTQLYDPRTIIAAERRLYIIRTGWGIISPYVIGLAGGPIGSAILRSSNLADSIEPLSAVRAAAVGGIFATPIYFLVAYMIAGCLRPCCMEDPTDPPGPVPMAYAP